MWFYTMTSGPWWMDLAAFATALTAAGVVWRMVIWPFLRAVWMAIRAAPQIPIILDEMKVILQSDVLEKLEEMKATFTTHEVEAAKRDNRLDYHTNQLENHEIRITRLERDGHD